MQNFTISKTAPQKIHLYLRSAQALFNVHIKYNHAFTTCFTFITQMHENVKTYDKKEELWFFNALIFKVYWHLSVKAAFFMALQCGMEYLLLELINQITKTYIHLCNIDTICFG